MGVKWSGIAGTNSNNYHYFSRQIQEKAKGEKRNHGISAQTPTFVKDDIVVDKRENSSVRPQSVRRKNAREKDKLVYGQEGVEEKDMVFSTISNDDLVDKAALVEENPKDIREVSVDSVTDRAESSSAASQRSRHEFGDGSVEGRTNKFNGGGSELEGESSDDAEDEDDEETQEDRNKAVEWNEDDQKNLLDLGLSEMERNKRLESLIARRKARKILSMQVRRTLMNTGTADPCCQIASLLIPKSNNPCPPNVSGSAPVSPTPGSAPSVLVPMHNPFDLPYDPQEEKPNLTGGSFEEEFMSASQKDLMFCRHESFSLGAFFPGPGEFDQSRRGTFYYPNFAARQRAPEIPEYSRFRSQSGKEDPGKLIQMESALDCKPMLPVNSSHDHDREEDQASERLCDLVDIHPEEDRSEIHTESNVGRDVTGGLSSSSSSELNVPFSAANKEQILRSLSFSVPRNIAVDREYNGQRNEPLCDGSPSFGNKIPEEHFFFGDKGVHHTPTHSIASDLQVEVSEVSSADLTVDGTISPSDGESLTYDGDVEVEKETTSGSEEMWVASSQLSRVEENESRSREVHEVSEQDILEVGFSRINNKSEDIIASDMLREKVVEQDSMVTGMSSSSKTELPESSKTNLTEFDGNVHEEVRLPSASYSSDALSTENLASLPNESALQSSDKSVTHPSHPSDSGKQEERSHSLEKSAQEVNITRDMNEEVVFANDDNDILEFIKNTYGEAPKLIKREDSDGPSVLATIENIRPLEITEGNSGVPENDHSSSTEQFEGEEFRRQSVPISNLIGNENIQDRNSEQGVVDFGSSGDNQNSSDTIPSVTWPEIVAEQGPPDSSSSSSPTSVAEEKAPVSQVSPWNFDQTTQIEVQQISADVVDDNFLDRTLPESSNLTVSPDALHLTEDSVTCLSNDKDPEKSQGDHQTILESYKPAEESVNSNSSDDYEAQLEMLAEHVDMAAPSRPIEKMDIWESIQDREREQGAVDVRLSGVSQISTVPIPSAMLPELVVEQLPTASSSSSSPNFELQKMASVEQTSSSSIYPEMHLKVQNSDEEIAEINMLDKLLPENLAPPAPQSGQHLSSDSTAYPSYDKDLEELQEPSNPLEKSTQEVNSTYTLKDSEVPANHDTRNSETIHDINSEAHISTKEENVGILSKVSEESMPKSINVTCIEGQTGKLGEGQTMLDSCLPIGNTDNLKTFEDHEGKHLKLSECDNTAETSNPVEHSNTLNTNQECDILEVGIFEISRSTGEVIAPVMLVGTAESGLPAMNQSYLSDPNPPTLLPEVVVEPVRTASSSSSSPNSVLQNKFSLDHGSVLSLESLEIQTEALQSETQMAENAMSNGLQPESLTAAVPQNVPYSMEDSMAHPSNSGYSGDLQEPSDSPGNLTTEDTVNLVTNSESNDMEEKLNSKSVEDGEGHPIFIKQEALMDPMEPSDTTTINSPEGGLKQMTDNGAVIGKSKQMEQNENAETAEGREELEETMESKVVGDSPMPTDAKNNLEATEVDEGKSKNSTAHEANVFGLSQPIEQNDDASIPITSIETEEPSKDNPGRRSIEGANIMSNEKELVDNVMVGEDLKSSVGDTEGESQRLLRSENAGVTDSSTIENDEGKPEKLTEAEAAMVGLSQSSGKNDKLNDTRDTEEARNVVDH